MFQKTSMLNRSARQTSRSPCHALHEARLTISRLRVSSLRLAVATAMVLASSCGASRGASPSVMSVSTPESVAITTRSPASTVSTTETSAAIQPHSTPPSVPSDLPTSGSNADSFRMSFSADFCSSPGLAKVRSLFGALYTDPKMYNVPETNDEWRYKRSIIQCYQVDPLDPPRYGPAVQVHLTWFSQSFRVPPRWSDHSADCRPESVINVKVGSYPVHYCVSLNDPRSALAFLEFKSDVVIELLGKVAKEGSQWIDAVAAIADSLKLINGPTDPVLTTTTTTEPFLLSPDSMVSGKDLTPAGISHLQDLLGFASVAICHNDQAALAKAFAVAADTAGAKSAAAEGCSMLVLRTFFVYQADMALIFLSLGVIKDSVLSDGTRNKVNGFVRLSLVPDRATASWMLADYPTTITPTA